MGVKFLQGATVLYLSNQARTRFVLPPTELPYPASTPTNTFIADLPRYYRTVLCQKRIFLSTRYLKPESQNVINGKSLP
jgi:hypothetical protein